MKDIQAGNVALGAAITAGNAADAAIQAAKLEAHFTEAAAIFTKEGVENATKMSKEIADAAGDYAKAARAGDMSGAGKAKTSIAKCQACHMAHREQLPDKSYKLKK
jgi:hypothetical protein